MKKLIIALVVAFGILTGLTIYGYIKPASSTERQAEIKDWLNTSVDEVQKYTAKKTDKNNSAQQKTEEATKNSQQIDSSVTDKNSFGSSPDTSEKMQLSWSNSQDGQFMRAFEQKKHGEMMKGSGTVHSILKDDNKGTRHQRFIVQLASGQTLLIAHNIDLAPRVRDLQVGRKVDFYGQYEWNREGGVIHWTHKDPDNKHEHGWIKYNGKTVQ